MSLNKQRNIETMLMLLSMTIWAVLDRANPFVVPSSAPWAIGLVYSLMIWGFGSIALSANLARDLGTRIVAAIFYGRDAFPTYSAIAILVNVPAPVIATLGYEVMFKDSFANIAEGHNVHEDGEEGLTRHLTRTGTLEGRPAGSAARKRYTGSSESSNENGRKETSPV